MASSSTRSTFVETIIRAHFKWVYWRIHANDTPRNLNLITERFADVLDMDFWDLIDTLDPPGNVLDPEKRRLIKQDVERWEKRKQHYRSLDRSANVWEAASRCSDVGAVLFSCGRDREARAWCELVDEMQRWAGTLLHEEKKWEKVDEMRYGD
ncbi:hypothetical protein Tdes44962_MAKER02182 [Teratosphaeria destructans]|uniref:Uncharacterized protein n=1 Tax=Teratosphaeria destructans TaxID=418781 RepID=A0A9W7SVE6_9PEZI|nr:hypothetical protein Tdes44962_MAKER02182 [Teratosphaeria destructans]